MAVNKGVWGIDIGECALKALRLELIDGKPTATAFDYIEHTKILSQPDADRDGLIREALEKFLSRNQLKLDEVAIGIAGQSGLARFVKLPPVEEKKIAEIVKFEAKQQIPFPLDEVVWDFQKIAGGEAVDGFALETEIGLFAMKRDVISRWLGYYTASKVEVHIVQMSPLALVNFATYEILKKGGTTPVEAEAEVEPDDAPKGKKRSAVIMDIGTDASNLIITDGAKIIWQRPIPLGGNHFTRALTKELKLTFAKAEHLKRNAAKSPEMANILKAIKPVLTDFVGEVQRSLGYFTNTHRDAHVAYMVGLGSAFKLPGLQKYLSDKLSIEVKKPTSFPRLQGDGVLADPLFQENLLTFPIAYGLALQGLGQARLVTNLLPAEIRFDRLIRAKKPYAVSAAAMLLIGTAGLAMGFSEELKSVSDKRIEASEVKAKSAASLTDAQKTKYDATVEQAKVQQAMGKTIIAGQEERLNWARFYEVQTAAMPRPGDKDHGGNLIATSAADFDWRGQGNVGIEALKWFERRMRTGVPIEQALEDDASKHPTNLAMVNVEAVHTRWVTNVQGFLTAVDNEVWGDGKTKGYAKNISDYLLENEKEPDPEKNNRMKPVWKPKLAPGEKDEGAWVVEIRGYTDHKDAQDFLKRGLIRNLQKFDKFAEQGEVTIRTEDGKLIKVKSDAKVGQYIVGVTDPVKERVSHAFVYNAWMVNDALPNSFLHITTSYLEKLLGANSSGGGGQPGAPPAVGGPSPMGSGTGPMGVSGGDAPAAPAVLGPMWTPLPNTTSAGTAASTSGGNTLGTTGSGPGPMGGGTTASSGGDKKEGGVERRRYEFVVMFIWREPIPSGSGTPTEAAPPADSGGLPGPGPVPGKPAGG